MKRETFINCIYFIYTALKGIKRCTKGFFPLVFYNIKMECYYKKCQKGNLMLNLGKLETRM